MLLVCIDRKKIGKTSTGFSRVYRNLFYSVSNFKSCVSFFSFQDLEFLNYEYSVTKIIEQLNSFLLLRAIYFS